MKKTRKTPTGPIREKARTMKNLEDAVGSLLTREGYAGLSGVKIAKEARVAHSLIYIYFGSVSNLVESYIKKTDFWTPETNPQLQDILNKESELDRDGLIRLLQNQFATVLQKRELQRILQWEISQKNDVLTKISQEREDLGEHLFQYLETDFKDSFLDLRAILSILISGLYYLSLHAVNNGTTFCGIDINEPEGKSRIDTALKQMINLCYDTIS